MSNPYLIIWISIIWLASEVGLAIFKRSSKASTQADRSSAKYLWITIGISIFVGVFLGMKGIGLIPRLFPVLSVAGLILIVAGLIIRWIAVLTLRKYFTVDVAIARDHRIIDTGLYGLVRHPAYLGSLLSFFGLPIYFSNWLSFLVILVPVFLAFNYRIRVEEEALSRAFGQDYIDYVKRTKRLVPGIY